MRALLIFQGVTGISIYLRILVILYSYGIAGLGVFSYYMTVIGFLSLGCQLVNNQGIHIIAMRDMEANPELFIRPMSVLLFCNGIIAAALLILVVSILDNKQIISISSIEIFPILLTIWLTLLCSIFDFVAIVNGEVHKQIKAQMTGAVISTVFICISYLFDQDESILVWAPFVNIFGICMCYLYFKAPAYVWRNVDIFSNNWKCLLSYWLNIKSTAHLNTIPYISVISDLVLKNIISAHLGLKGVGMIQIYQSIESFVGNIFVGPLYRKALFDFNYNHNDISHIYKKYTVLIVAPILILAFLLYVFGVLFPQDIFNTPKILEKLFEYSGLISVVILLRIPYVMWGLTGQLLLTKRKMLRVSSIENGGKIMTILIVFFSAKLSLITNNTYLYATFFTGVTLSIFAFGGYMSSKKSDA